MGNRPYMPLMMGDWIRGTRGMKAEVRGVYISLLIHQYDNGFLPDDIEELRLIDPEIDKVWEKLKDKFKLVEKGKLSNQKLEDVRKFFDKQKSNGNQGGRPRKNPNNNPNDNPNDNPNNNLHNEYEYDILIDIERKDKKEGVGEKEGNPITEPIPYKANSECRKWVLEETYSEIFRKQWVRYLDYMAMKGKSYMDIPSQEHKMKELWQVATNDEIAIKVIEQTISDLNKSFYPLKQLNGRITGRGMRTFDAPDKGYIENTD